VNLFLDFRHRYLSGRLLSVATILLFVIGTAYLIRGTYFLFTDAGDFYSRWVEQQYVFRAKNPFDIVERHIAESEGKPAPQVPRDSSIESDLGLPGGGYPPWAYFTGAVLGWPPTPTAARWYFGLMNLGLLSFLLIWAFNLGLRDGKRVALFFAASLLATSSICSTFGVGQYGVVVLSALAGAWWLDQKNRWVLAGLLLGVAMTKITLAGPFMLPFLVKQRWQVLMVATGYIGLGSVIIWLVVKTNPIEMLQQLLAVAEYYALEGYSLVNILAIFGVETRSAMELAAPFSLALAMVLSYIWRSAPMLTHFAIAALTARLWTYHKDYDNLIMIFLLMALGVVAFRNYSRLAIAGFFVMGLSLWLPGRLTDIQVYRVFQCVAWLGCLAVLLIVESNNLQSNYLKTKNKVANIN
jgi:hypothetical protein